MISKEELCKKAIEAMKHAYVPYSGYKVGAALLTKEEDVYLGCNIENAAYSPTMCAERTAIFKAVSEGKREFQMIAVCGGKDGNIGGAFPPCGTCRQVMAEFCEPDFPILVITGSDPLSFKEYTLSELLPLGFSPKYMEE